MQQWMASRILHPEPREDDGAERLLAPPRGDRAERLAVYVNGYPARVQEAIAECFPAVTHLIGHRATHELVARYLRALVHHSYNVNDVGADLPAFLCDDVLCVRFPFLPDLARLEWAINRAFHAHLCAPLDPALVATWTAGQWSRAVLRFQPSVTLVCSPWPIRDLWAARETPIEEIDIDLRDRPERVLVRRAGVDVRCESVGRDQAQVLAALMAGRTLGDVSDRLLSSDSDPVSVSTWFARWMQQGLIIGCSSDPAGGLET
jgi:hypothetical protein